MVNYYTEELFQSALAHKKKIWTYLYLSIAVYIALSAMFIILFLRQPYESKNLALIKWLHYCVTGIFVIYMSIFLGIKFKRVNKFYKLCRSFNNGFNREYFGEFVGVDEAVSNREGVDVNYVEFKEYNKDKGAFFIRKVSVLVELGFPDIKEGDHVQYFTHNNFLIKYEIKQNKVEENK